MIHRLFRKYNCVQMKNLLPPESRRLPALTFSLALAAFFTLNASATVEQDEFVLRNVTLAHRKIFEWGDFFQDVVDTSGGRIVVRDRTMGPLPPMTRSHAVWKVRHFLFGSKLFRKLSPPFDVGRFVDSVLFALSSWGCYFGFGG